jgi:transcriptional regulator with XRE-family HTH domain
VEAVDSIRLSPAEIGQNLQEVRLRRGLSQAETAAKANVSERTLRRLESGQAVRPGTLSQVCEALGWNAVEATTSVRFLRREDAAAYRLHRPEDTFWYTTDDRRKKVPEDDLLRIQDPAERHRLGHLGLVDMFVGTLRFSIPDGPGIAFFEVYGPVLFGGGTYRELFLYCLRGDLTFTVAGETVRVAEGGGINLGPEPVPLRPTSPVERDGQAPLLMHIGVGIIKAPASATRS